MPAYNAARFINEAIDSLLTQYFTDFELWIIDDASTDRTQVILSKYTDSRIRIYRNEVNRGRDFIVNHFVKMIQTPFFTITDADDVSHPQRLQKQLEILNNDSTLMMCGTSYYTIDEEGFIGRKISLLSDYNELIKAMDKHAQFHGPVTVMRKDCISRYDPFYRVGYFEAFADADLCSRIAGEAKAINLSEPLYFYRIIEHSMSRKDITPFGLNYYQLVNWLYKQRKQTKKDAIDRGEYEKINAYKKEITQSYDLSFFSRHLSFTHLYWGLRLPSIKNAWKAITYAPLGIKNWLSFFFILFRCGLLYLNRTMNSRHYSVLIRMSS
jgi:glycosyltransferase involved in cell wall biosynthesis